MYGVLRRSTKKCSKEHKIHREFIAACLLGGVLASIPAVALAQTTGGHRTCAAFCRSAFGPREAAECTRAGARGEGPCFECTPGVGPGPNFTPPECGTTGETFDPSWCERVDACTTGAFTCGMTADGRSDCQCQTTIDG